MGKTRDLFKEIGVTRGVLPINMGKIKARNGKDLPKQKGLIKKWQEYMKEPYRNVWSLT